MQFSGTCKTASLPWWHRRVHQWFSEWPLYNPEVRWGKRNSYTFGPKLEGQQNICYNMDRASFFCKYSKITQIQHLYKCLIVIFIFALCVLDSLIFVAHGLRVHGFRTRGDLTTKWLLKWELFINLMSERRS